MTIRRAILAAVLVASVVLMAVVIGWQPDPGTPVGPSSGLKIVVIGIDGLDWFLARRMLEDGTLPSVASFLRRGLTGEMAAEFPVIPETGWTVLGRGRGLSEDELGRLSGPDGRLFGLAPELARVVTRSGGKALSIGWPGSWPVSADAGVVVAPYRPHTPVHETGLPAAVLAGDARFCSESVGARVDGIIARTEGECEAEFQRLIYDGDAADAGWHEHLLAARWAFLSDLTTINLAASLMADEEPDLTMVCFGGMDAVGHRFLASAEPSFFTNAPPGHERYEDILTDYFAFIDDCVERLRRLSDQNTVFLICSTYGTHPSLDVPSITGAHVNGPPGVVMYKCPDVPSRQRPLSLSGVDIAPTLLALLGMEIPTDMDGRVVQEMLPPSLLRTHPPQYSGSIDPKGVEPAPSDLAAADALVSERLDALRNRMDR